MFLSHKSDSTILKPTTRYKIFKNISKNLLVSHDITFYSILISICSTTLTLRTRLFVSSNSRFYNINPQFPILLTFSETLYFQIIIIICTPNILVGMSSDKGKVKKKKTKRNNNQIDLCVSIRIPLFAKAFIKRYNDEKCIQLMSPGKKKNIVTVAKNLSSVYGSIVKNPRHVGRRMISMNVDL